MSNIAKHSLLVLTTQERMLITTVRKLAAKKSSCYLLLRLEKGELRSHVCGTGAIAVVDFPGNAAYGNGKTADISGPDACQDEGNSA